MLPIYTIIITNELHGYKGVNIIIICRRLITYVTILPTSFKEWFLFRELELPLELFFIQGLNINVIK